ncbi:MAG: TetR family transcriptional regulator [Streptosporangiales bacterium]|nr:TetR family transcriptional regulator [Streptosporangiales bacterium]
MTTRRAGLRERKKQATREALREAALKLALEHGPDNVRVDDIAEAAGVSPRTYNNYFSSREQAIVAAVTAEREARVAAAVAARPAHDTLAKAVIEAVVEQYTDQDDPGPDALLLITTRTSLREVFIDSATAIEHPLTDAIADRLGDPPDNTDRHTARVLAASVAAAVRIALEQWVQPATIPSTTGAPSTTAGPPTTADSPTTGRLVVLSGSLPDLLRKALAPLTPALDAAEHHQR